MKPDSGLGLESLADEEKTYLVKNYYAIHMLVISSPSVCPHIDPVVMQDLHQALLFAWVPGT